jgi:hypothetical protein
MIKNGPVQFLADLYNSIDYRRMLSNLITQLVFTSKFNEKKYNIT